MKHYLIIAGRSKKKQTDIFMVQARSGKEAHEKAIEDYRVEHRLGSNIQISTHTVFEDESEQKVQAFMARLIAKMEEQRAEA